MHYEAYERIDYGVPAGCTKDCPCRTTALTSPDNPHEIDICLDPSRLKSLKAKETRARRTNIREASASDIAEFVTATQFDELDGYASRGLALLAEAAIYNASMDARRQLAKALPHTHKAIADILTSAKYSMDAGSIRWKRLADLPPAMLINAMSQLAIHAELNSCLELCTDRRPETDFLLGRPARDPHRPNPTITSETCCQCDGDIAASEIEAAPLAISSMGITRWPSGALLMPGGHEDGEDDMYYCTICAPDIPICSKCGCSGDTACPEHLTTTRSFVSPTAPLCQACATTASDAAGTESQ